MTPSSPQKKIVVVTDAWHPQVNGVVTVFEKIRVPLEARGYSLSIIHPYLFNTVPLPTYKEIPIALPRRKALEALIRFEKPDYIHIATEGPLGFAARNACIRMQMPFTTSYHTNFPEYIHMRFGFFARTTYAYLRWFHSRGAKTMVATESLRSELLANGFTHVVNWPLGVDTSLFTRNTSAPALPYPEPYFVYFGRLAVEKNLDAFLKLNLPGTKLVIGDGPDRTRLEMKYGKKAVFLGYKKGNALVDILSRAGVFVLPSKTETFGLTTLEALACSVPVAAYNVPGPKDIVRNGIDGVLGDDLEHGALAALALSGEACREGALRFSWEKSAEAFVQNLSPITRI